MKKLISNVLLLVMCFLGCALQTMADESHTKDMIWDETIDGIRYIHDATKDYVYVVASTVHKVIIPEEITVEGETYYVSAIQEKAFKSNTTVDTLSIPVTVTAIGNNAFDDCTALKYVEFRDTFLIKDTKFEQNNPQYIENLSEHPVNAGYSAASSILGSNEQLFWNCSNFTTLYLGRDITYMAGDKNKPFQDNSNLKSVDVGPQVNKINFELFRNCENLEKVNLVNAKKLERIEKQAFYQCRKIDGVTIPASVVFIGALNFQESSTTVGNLKYVTILGEEDSPVLRIDNVMSGEELGTFTNCGIENMYIGRNI